MSNAEFASSESVNLTDTDRLNIILKYMEYSAKLMMVHSIIEPDKAVQHRATVAALCTMLQLCKSDETIMRMECELQQAENSPVWALELP